MSKLFLVILCVTAGCFAKENRCFSEHFVIEAQAQKQILISEQAANGKHVFLELRSVLKAETASPAAPILAIVINGTDLSQDNWPVNLKSTSYIYVNRTTQGAANIDFFQNGNWAVQVLSDIESSPKRTDTYYSPELAIQNKTYIFDITGLLSVNSNRIILKNNHPVLPLSIEVAVLISDKGTSTVSQKKSSVSNVFMVKDPIFSDLLSDQKPAYSGHSAIIWVHHLEPTIMCPYAKQYAVPYIWEDQFRELAELALTPLLNWSLVDVNGPGVGDTPWPTQKFIQKYGFKVLFDPYYNKGRYIGIKHKAYHGDWPYLFDPEVKQVFLDDIKDSLLKNGGSKVYWGVFSGDEIREIGLESTIYIWDQQRNSYAYINEINNEVTNKYGFGKYGIPSPDDTNPYKWIAVQRWCDAKVVEWQKSIYELVKSIDPNIAVVGTDSGGRNRQWDFPGESKYLDIATHQLQPDGDPNNCTLGFMTKVLSDTMGKTVWPLPQIGNYFGCYNPDEVAEMMSQTFRSGATGFNVYLVDSKNRSSLFGWTPSCKYGAPSRWATIIDICATAREMNTLKFPQPDFALFYSIDAHSATPNPKASSACPYSRETEYAFTFLGPHARSWFKVVCDNQLAYNLVDLKKYKALYIPFATYQRSAVIEQIKSYARQGGTVICCDPRTFSFDIDGTDLTAVREEMFGVHLANSRSNDSIRPIEDLHLPRQSKLSIQDGYTIEPITNIKVLASYSDGKPAIVVNKYGKGTIIFFAFNPFTKANLSDSNWQNFFKAFQKKLGLRTGHDIWRFKFPVKEYNEPKVNGYCLTNNHMRWELNKALFPFNIGTGGTYTYSIFPDFKSDVNSIGKIGFDQGRLTDRRKAPVSKTVANESTADGWVVSWLNEKPLDLAFDFSKSFVIDKVRLLYSEQLPGTEILISDDGCTWKTVGHSIKQSRTNDICEYVQDGIVQTGRYVKIRFNQRDPGCKMEIIEVEVWGK